MRVRTTLAIGTLAALAYAPTLGRPVVVAAQTPQAPAFPSTPPKPGAPRDFHVPAPRRFTLENGLEVALVQWGNMPKVRVTVWRRSSAALIRDSRRMASQGSVGNRP